MTDSTINHFLKIRQVALSELNKKGLIKPDVREWARYEVSAEILEVMIERGTELIQGAETLGVGVAANVVDKYNVIHSRVGTMLSSPSSPNHITVTLYRVMGIMIDLGWVEDITTLRDKVRAMLNNHTTTKQMGIVAELRYPYVMVPYVVDVFLSQSI